MEKCFSIAGPCLSARESLQAGRGGLLPPPVGTSDWARFSRDSYCVDKTLILKDLIDSKSHVVLFTRPRRFGKTTMLEMIRAFYEDDLPRRGHHGHREDRPRLLQGPGRTL